MPIIGDNKLKRQFYLIDSIIEGYSNVWRCDFYLEVIGVVVVGLDLFFEGGVLRVKVG